MRRFLDPSGRLPANAWRAAGYALALWLALVVALIAKVCGHGPMPAATLSLASLFFPSFFLIPHALALPEKERTGLERRDRVSLAALVTAFVLGAGFAIYGIVVGSIMAGYLAFPGIGLASLLSRMRVLSLATLEKTA